MPAAAARVVLVFQSPGTTGDGTRETLSAGLSPRGRETDRFKGKRQKVGSVFKCPPRTGKVITGARLLSLCRAKNRAIGIGSLAVDPEEVRTDRLGRPKERKGGSKSSGVRSGQKYPPRREKCRRKTDAPGYADGDLVRFAPLPVSSSLSPSHFPSHSF